jgi:hypothetical protein
MGQAARCVAFFVFLSIAGVGQCVNPTPTVNVAPDPLADSSHGLVFTTFWAPNEVMVADLNATPTWASCPRTNQKMVRPSGTGSTYLAIEKMPSGDNLIAEINSSQSIVWSASMSITNGQLAAMGLQPVLNWNHDIIRLPNGWTASIGQVERLIQGYQCTGITTNGLPDTCDVLGDAIVAVDVQRHVRWYWNAFDWNTPAGLPWSRAAILGETCTSKQSGGKRGCPITLAPHANDWLHANSLYYDADGNLIVSLRHQDWVIKIAFGSGTGDGHIIWRLGNQGDFQMLSSIPNPWFSHQHEVERETNGWISLFDNGNTRHAADSTSHSRGQALIVDEQAMTASLGFNVDLGVYSQAYGSAQMLSNGNWWFLAGDINTRPQSMQMFEFTQAGQLVYQVTYPNTSYRSFRLAGLFN